MAVYVIVLGNPIDGLTLLGPFDKCDTANDYADQTSNIRNDIWCVVELESPALEPQ